ncbi:hypothetical protein [Thermoplasma volcanium GSS1]|uniref:Thioesterase domain-containing protein n=1 Tax=Thermoplasma volcanium (strain ATCC 51530 / DSM 4299 / JCM 9571 / NBRC 15438 / GSS1) TaxID=273116 RepID=Q97AV4_THEVO|nr:thioesterase family protein [Thermoplasma volcanium]BAB59847.1 hypothetical protein [Thermoplasma volcanium GSS1]
MVESAYSKTKIQVRYNDLDTVGHVNNAIYFTYFEIGRIDFINKFLWKFKSDEINFVIARAEADFIKSILLYDVVYVRTWISRVGNTSFDFSYRLEDEDGKEYATGKTINVILSNGKPSPVPNEIKALLMENEN